MKTAIIQVIQSNGVEYQHNIRQCPKVTKNW